MADTRKDWFREAKYGLFMHWGLYSILAGEYKGVKTDRIAEWIMNYLHIPAPEYEKLAELFNPQSFNADEIVRMAKEEWGMKYMVFTTKHHEGFAMWDSACSDYNVVKASPYGKDILKELQLACEKYDMRLGLYYSQAQDWDDPDGFMYGQDSSVKDFDAYLERKCIPQLKELLTQYGKISIIWFDTPMEMTEAQSARLAELVHSLQPDCLISGRIGNGLGDYMTTGDNFIPRLPIERDWEVPATLNDTWGFNKDDHNWKDPDELLRLLLKIVSRGGNYLLNIGPDKDGNVPKESIRILSEVGKYVRENEEAIFGTKCVGVYPYELQWAELTGKDHKLYVHMLAPRMRIELLGIANSVKGAYLVKDHTPLEVCARKVCEGDSIIEVELTEELRKSRYYAVCIELGEAEPVFEEIRG